MMPGGYVLQNEDGLFYIEQDGKGALTDDEKAAKVFENSVKTD